MYLEVHVPVRLGSVDFLSYFHPLSPVSSSIISPFFSLQLLLPPVLKLQLPVNGAQNLGDVALFEERGKGV